MQTIHDILNVILMIFFMKKKKIKTRLIRLHFTYQHPHTFFLSTNITIPYLYYLLKKKHVIIYLLFIVFVLSLIKFHSILVNFYDFIFTKIFTDIDIFIKSNTINIDIFINECNKYIE